VSRRRLWLASALPWIVLVAALLLGRVGSVVPGRVDDAARRVTPGAAYAVLEELQTRYPGRDTGSPALAGATRAVADMFRAAGAQEVRLESLDTESPYCPRVTNVLAVVPGIDRGAAIVLAAHSDTVAGAPGAIDDGGAVAVLVETARVLSEGPPPACDVELVVFDGEESGLLRSKDPVEALGTQGRDRVRAAIAVELVGWTEDQLVVHTIPYGFAWEAAGITPAWLPARVTAAARHAGVPVGVGDPLASPWYQGIVRVLGVLTGSDAGAYLERGVPSCMLSGSALTNFYTAYHTSDDTLSQVDPAHLDAATRALVAAAVELSAAADAPREFGEAYLFVGPSLLGRNMLLLLAASAFVPLGLCAPAVSRGGVVALLLVGLTVLALAAAGSVLGVLVGWPFAALLPLATLHRRSGFYVKLLGLLPLLVGAALFASAVLSFGFRWRAGLVETMLLVLTITALFAAAALVRTRSAAP
jgi:hypothetical protein